MTVTRILPDNFVSANSDVQVPAFLRNSELQNADEVVTAFTQDDAVTASYRTAALSKGKVDGRVSNEWANRPEDEKFLSLSHLYNTVLARSQNSRSALLSPADIRVISEDNLTLDMGTGEKPVDMTHFSFGQLATLVKCPADYLRRLPNKLAAINLQHGLMAYSGDAMQAFTYHNGSDNLRAMTGKNYGRIYDHEVVKQVMQIAGNANGDTRWKIPGTIDWSSNNGTTVNYNPFVDITTENTTLYASDRDVFLFLVDDTHPIEVGKLDNGEPDLMFRGFIVWNSETGSKSFGMSTMLLRGVCQNRNIWGVGESSEIRIRHSRMAPERFAQEAGPMLMQYSNASTVGIVSKVTNAKATVVAKDTEEAQDFLTGKVKLTKGLADRVLDAVLKEENHPASSIWDMVQGITAVARTYKHQDARTSLEEKAGALMDKVAA